MADEFDFLSDEKPKNDTQTSSLSLGSIVLIVGVMAFVGVIALQLTRQNQTQPIPGQAAPTFEMTTFTGEPLSLAALRGQVVVVNFWGSWCAPCRDEAPDFQAIYEDFAGQGVVIVGVNWLDVEDEALAFLDEFGITYPNAPDVAEHVANAYNIDGAPETFIINRDGVVTHSILGPINYERLAANITEVLAQDGTA